MGLFSRVPESTGFPVMVWGGLGLVIVVVGSAGYVLYRAFT